MALPCCCRTRVSGSSSRERLILASHSGLTLNSESRYPSRSGEVVPLSNETEGDLAWPLREPGATAQADQAVAAVPAMRAAHKALEQRVERGGLGRQRVAAQTRGAPVGVGEEGDMVEAGQL